MASNGPPAPGAASKGGEAEGPAPPPPAASNHPPPLVSSLSLSSVASSVHTASSSSSLPASPASTSSTGSAASSVSAHSLKMKIKASTATTGGASGTASAQQSQQQMSSSKAKKAAKKAKKALRAASSSNPCSPASKDSTSFLIRDGPAGGRLESLLKRAMQEPPSKRIKVNGDLNGTSNNKSSTSQSSGQASNNDPLPESPLAEELMDAEESEQESKPSTEMPSDLLGDNEATTMTNPDHLGPCEPGTAVKLRGSLWEETEKGLLLVDIFWKGRSFTGTLIDCNRQSDEHKWGPPREAPAIAKGRGKRGRTSRARTPPVKGKALKVKQTAAFQQQQFNVPVSPLAKSSLAASETASSTSGKDKRRSFQEACYAIEFNSEDKVQDDDADSDNENQDEDFLISEDGIALQLKSVDPPVKYIECAHPGCAKKFRDQEAMKFHLSFAHNELKAAWEEKQKEAEEKFREKEERKRQQREQEERKKKELDEKEGAKNKVKKIKEEDDQLLDKIKKEEVKTESMLTNGNTTSVVATVSAAAVAAPLPLVKTEQHVNGKPMANSPGLPIKPPHDQVVDLSKPILPTSKHPIVSPSVKSATVPMPLVGHHPLGAPIKSAPLGPSLTPKAVAKSMLASDSPLNLFGGPLPLNGGSPGVSKPPPAHQNSRPNTPDRSVPLKKVASPAYSDISDEESDTTAVTPAIASSAIARGPRPASSVTAGAATSIPYPPTQPLKGVNVPPSNKPPMPLPGIGSQLVIPRPPGAQMTPPRLSMTTPPSSTRGSDLPGAIRPSSQTIGPPPPPPPPTMPNSPFGIPGLGQGFGSNSLLPFLPPTSSANAVDLAALAAAFTGGRGDTAALNLLQQHAASQYLASTKLQELQERASSSSSSSSSTSKSSSSTLTMPPRPATAAPSIGRSASTMSSFDASLRGSPQPRPAPHGSSASPSSSAAAAHAAAVAAAAQQFKLHSGLPFPGMVPGGLAQPPVSLPASQSFQSLLGNPRMPSIFPPK